MTLPTISASFFILGYAYLQIAKGTNLRDPIINSCLQEWRHTEPIYNGMLVPVRTSVDLRRPVCRLLGWPLTLVAGCQP